jgi:hypothetical protein
LFDISQSTYAEACLHGKFLLGQSRLAAVRPYQRSEPGARLGTFMCHAFILTTYDILSEMNTHLTIRIRFELPLPSFLPR